MTSPEFPSLENFVDKSPLKINSPVFNEVQQIDAYVRQQEYTSPGELTKAMSDFSHKLDLSATKEGISGGDNIARLSSPRLYIPQFIIDTEGNDENMVRSTLKAPDELDFEPPSTLGVFFGFSAVPKIIRNDQTNPTFGFGIHYQISPKLMAPLAFIHGNYINHAPANNSSLEFFADKKVTDFNQTLAYLEQYDSPELRMLLGTLERLLGAKENPLADRISVSARCVRLYIEHRKPDQHEADLILDILTSKVGLYADHTVDIKTSLVFEKHDSKLTPSKNVKLTGKIIALSYSNPLVSTSSESSAHESQVPTLVVDIIRADGTKSPVYVHLEHIRDLQHS